MKFLVIILFIVSVSWTTFAVHSFYRTFPGRYQLDKVSVVLWSVLFVVAMVWFVSSAGAADLRIPPLHRVINQTGSIVIGKSKLPKERPDPSVEPLSRPAGMP